MSAQPREKRPQRPAPTSHPERRTTGDLTPLMAGSLIVRGFATHAEAMTDADTLARVLDRRLEVHRAGCGPDRFWAVFPPDPAWRQQVGRFGQVHAHVIEAVIVGRPS
ncbi:hypothetical protein [Pseudokineococcus lusitanus]|uniref:Uncharacterized protein n=1 Tax=Pseudokineococcus lusitanus TaxID=763993 RepID=A0A3N1HTY1_9ACTN|nr:hypothetical protein [Pseudokineococcus lusitanus]ROP45919.1 hypothetical protein EDC03_0534 [Pseudokineococcus lusitanus]